MGLIRDILQHPVLIEYLAGANNYTWLHFQNGRRQLISKPLRYFEKHLPDFVRVHKTALINPQYVLDWQAPPRRRMAGSVRMHSKAVLPVGRRRWADVMQTLPKEAEQPTVPAVRNRFRSVICMTDDTTKALLLQQTVEGQCPDCLIHCVNGRVALPELLQLLPDAELPVLLLLDARFTPVSRLSVLRALKSNARTASIPTLLLISEDAGDEAQKGYAERANSVIPVSDQNHLFVQTVTQVAQYWLNLTRLPSPT